MKRTQWIALALVLVILAPLLAACSDGGGKARPPVELVIYSQVANYSGVMIGWGAEILKEKFNVTVTIINDATDGTFETRMAAGNLGDIVIFGSDGDQYKDASEAGMLFDWEEDGLLEEFGPYILQHFPYALEKNRGITGTLHGFGHGVAGSASDHARMYYYPQIRWDLYTQLGRPDIDTLEDFIPLLARMVELEPVSDAGTKTYAVSSFPDWDGDMVMMVKSTAALYGWEEFYFGLYDTKTQTWENCLEEDGWYLRCLKFYNTLYQMGLYDPDSMTQNWNVLVEKYTTGAALFNIFEWIASYYNTEENKAQGKMMRPVPAKDQKNLADGLTIFGRNRVWTIGAKSNYPELCMEIINWFSTPEGVLAYNYGPRGVTWDFDEDGEPYMTALGIQCQEDKENTPITYRDYSGTYRNGEFQHNNPTWDVNALNPESPSGQTFHWEFWPSTILQKVVTPIEQSWRDWAGYIKEDDFLKENGHFSVAVGTDYSGSRQSSELKTTWTQVQNCVKDGSWNAIYARDDAEFDATVAKMRADAYAYGFQECVDWIEIEVGRRKAAEDRAK
ncbi:MAG: extracellular solute-binding protein [Oscillospiraceae bacterium]|nr:extracellular solute-binding protein [Oscillospiraceae bacterium]